MDYEKKYKEALEEAAEEYAYTNWEDNDYHEGASEGLPFDAIGHTEKCFKAGAEWQKEQKQPVVKDPFDDEQFRRGYEAGKHDAMREQKPVEWSDDFDKEVENVHKRYPEVSYAKLTRIAYHFSKWANRYKDIEWSEEDEETRKDIIAGLEATKRMLYRADASGQACYNRWIDWLKSLRPSWKPSEEQPDNEDVDKVAQELYEHLYELKRRNNVPTNLYDKQEIIDLWKAGIVYGRSHPKQEQPEADLEKEYKSYIESRKDDLSGNAITVNMKDLARHFYDLGLKARKEFTCEG